MQADRNLTGLPFFFLIVHTAALIIKRMIGEFERLQYGVQTIVAAAGDPDTDNAAIIVLDGTEEKISLPAEQRQIGAAPGSPAASSGKAGGSGFHLKVGLAILYRPQEGIDLLAVDLVVTCINRVHEILPPEKF
jgi:hypothetical protein